MNKKPHIANQFNIVRSLVREYRSYGLPNIEQVRRDVDKKFKDRNIQVNTDTINGTVYLIAENI